MSVLPPLSVGWSKLGSVWNKLNKYQLIFQENPLGLLFRMPFDDGIYLVPWKVLPKKWRGLSNPKKMKECKTSSQRVVNVFFWNQHLASTGQAMYFSNFTLSSTPWDLQYSKANLLCICNPVQHLESLQSWWLSICARVSNHGHHQGSLQHDLGSEYFSNCLCLLLHKVNEAGSEFPKSCQNWFDPQIRILFCQTSSQNKSAYSIRQPSAEVNKKMFGRHQ